MVHTSFPVEKMGIHHHLCADHNWQTSQITFQSSFSSWEAPVHWNSSSPFPCLVSSLCFPSFNQLLAHKIAAAALDATSLWQKSCQKVSGNPSPLQWHTRGQAVQQANNNESVEQNVQGQGSAMHTRTVNEHQQSSLMGWLAVHSWSTSG